MSKENQNAVYQNKYKCYCSCYVCNRDFFNSCPIKLTNPAIKNLGLNENDPWPEFSKQIFEEQYAVLR